MSWRIAKENGSHLIVSMQIKAHFREGRKSPWEARWWVNQKMRARFFATEKERDQFIREFQNDIKREGSKVFDFEGKKMRRWQIVDEMLPDVDPVDLARFWINNH